MEPLFEAKVTINEVLISYNIYRITQEKYKAELMPNHDSDTSVEAPSEFTLEKKENKWCTADGNYTDIVSTLGTEIDVFNYGYGDLLGRIGVA